MRKVLIVEDNLIASMHLTMMLGDMGYEIIGKLTFAEDVLEFIKANEPDIIFMDIMLEGKMSGIEAALEIRSYTDVPIIFLSALMDKVSTEDIAKVSNAKRTTKPFSDESITSVLQSVI